MTKRTGKKMGRPRMSEDERLRRVAMRLRPGDVDRLVAAARRRGVPTGSEFRAFVHAALTILDEPGPFTRAGLESWRVELGLDQVEDVTRSTTSRDELPAKVKAAGGGAATA
jgi:transposase-like protein